MIAELEGRISTRTETSVVVLVGGVGYKVRVATETLEKLASIGDETVRLFTYLAVRDDALDLYGFLDSEGLELFEQLITVTGIGPKTAMNIIGLAPVTTLRGAIASGDPAHLSKISGIGKKNAEKIVLELKDRFAHYQVKDAGYQEQSDVVEALKSLGYSERDAREALQKIDKKVATGSNTGEKIKAALKQLSR